MAINRVDTKGDAGRLTKEAQRKADIEQRALAQKQKQEQQRRNDREQGIYKRTVIDSYVATFAENYGDSFDYYSLVNALKFSFKSNPDGSLTPSFMINPENIEFKSDVEKQCKEFNENSYSDFITNEDTINGKNLDVYNFNNSEEHDAYAEGDVEYEDLVDLDGEFVSTTPNERYGTFNRINKLLGYTPPEESSALALNKAKKAWQKISNKR